MTCDWLRAMRGAPPLAAVILMIQACGGGDQGTPPPEPGLGGISIVAGGDQRGAPAALLPITLKAKVLDSAGAPVSAGDTVIWRVVLGGGSVLPETTITAVDGTALAAWTLGPAPGGQIVRASTLRGDSASAHATAIGAFQVASGGGNSPERYSSDLWVSNGYAYTGTWNWVPRTAGVGGEIKVFKLDGTGAPALVDSVLLANVVTVSDLEVSPDGSLLVATAEGGAAGGLYVYSLAEPASPALVAFYGVGTGLHTGSLSVIDGRLYAFGARNPPPALMIFDLSSAAAGTIAVADTISVPANYGIHDTFVRDGICFAFVWNEGVYIYDVGGGGRGGTPERPVRLSAIKTAGGEAHNGWWFHNPVTGEKRYLFVGQEGPGTIGSSSSGDIHVVDVSNLAAPVEVASYSLSGAGTHNFWMDEQNQRLYAAYYNGGVVALDVSGALSGDLSSREIARVRPGGNGNTYMWGVMLSGGSLYTIDMLSGLWQLAVP